MFTKKTVLILGAGASWHLGYPIGEELIKKIIQTDFSDEQPLVNRFKERLREMHPLNIDMFLSYHKEFEEVGKKIIAHELLKCEDKKAFHNLKSMTYFTSSKRAKNNTWYKFLLHSLIDECKPEDLPKNNDNLTIITFNYDLSLEYYLADRLNKMQYFKVGNKNYVEEFLKGLNIIHVYGQLGAFENIGNMNNYDNHIKKRSYDDKDKSSVDGYGDIFMKGKGTEEYVKNISKNIEVIGIEKWGKTTPKHIKESREKIKEAERVYVLGFGFLKYNIELIGFYGNSKANRIYYTNYKNFQKIERKLGLTSGVNYKYTKSEKKIYSALKEDFDFIE